MRKDIRYISENGRVFSTPEEAIEDDKRLPRTIELYTNDLHKMLEPGVRTFAGEAVTPERIEMWKKAIVGYEEKWTRAQISWGAFTDKQQESHDTN